jgi:Major tropism determinant N-terminal domain
MSEQLQLRRGSASENATFTGAQGECIVDTTNNRIVVGDGSTAGGFPAARLNEVQTIGRTTVNNLNYTVAVTDRMIGFSAVGTPLTVTLAASSLFAVGPRLTIVDESGSVTAAKTITIQPNGSDTINGVNAPIAIGSPFGSVTLENAGGGSWFVIEKENNIAPYTAVSDTSYQAVLSDTNIVFIALTSARQVTLPVSVQYPLGTVLSIADSTGNCSPVISITVTPNGSDLINGSGANFIMNSAFQYARFENTPTGWVIAAAAPTIQALPSIGLLTFAARGVNFDTAADTAIPITLPTGVTHYQIDSVTIAKASVAPTSAARVGLYTAASQGGVNLAAQQAVNTITSPLENTNDNSVRLALVNNTTITVNAANLFFNVGTINGAALTADVIITIRPC